MFGLAFYSFSFLFILSVFWGVWDIYATYVSSPVPPHSEVYLLLIIQFHIVDKLIFFSLSCFTLHVLLA